MSEFSFKGEISASKSLFNRALIVQSYFEELKIYGTSGCEDVLYMQEALQRFKHGSTELNCGAAGTVLRFLALRVAREKEEFLLTGSKELLSRLPQDLVQVLSQLGAQVKLTKEGFRIKGFGWQVMGDALHLQSKLSSQFATGVFINAWNYPMDLFITVPESMASMSYFKMTLSMLQNLGMTINNNKTEYHIPKKQKINNSSYVCEPDMGSVFAIVAAAILNGDACIENFPTKSLQPDFKFLQIIKKMGVKYKITNDCLIVKKQDDFKGIELNVKNNPDLVPVLSALCSFAGSSSHFYGAPHLINKESNRINSTYNLLHAAGIDCIKLDDGLKINVHKDLKSSTFEYYSEKDHRQAMAAGMFMLKNFNIKLNTKNDVNKSFPEFWDIIGKVD